MTPLRRVCCVQRFLHCSPYTCLRSSPFHKEKEFESEASVVKPTLPGSGISTSSSEDEISISSSEVTSLEKNGGSDFPEEPTTCCMSGCANCVWVEYAEQLSKVLKSGDKAKEMVLSKVSDPNMRAFLLMELKNLEDKNGGGTS